MDLKVLLQAGKISKKQVVGGLQVLCGKLFVFFMSWGE